jgi:hypothetical protein
MKKVMNEKALAAEAAFWGVMKKPLTGQSGKICHK